MDLAMPTLRALYQTAALAAWLLILLGAPAGAKDKHHPCALRLAQTPPPAAALYSQRALRQARSIIQLRMLELRKERLACIQEVLERRLPRDLLWDKNARTRYRGALPPCLHDEGALSR